MKVKLIPGPRDEAKIAAILNARETMSPEDWDDFCGKCAWTYDDAWFDALYYACENGDEMLADQAQYFHDCLLYEEHGYYAERMTRKWLESHMTDQKG